MNKGRMSRIITLCLVGMLLLSAVPAEQYYGAPITHGTANRVITEDMLSNTPPADYVIDMETQGKAADEIYCKYFLKEELQEVRIEINENNLNYLFQNALDEPYVMTDSVTIGDTTLGYCGLRTKGNYTLLHSYTDNPGSDRFSFTVNFGKYIKKEEYGKKQDFYGCNKICFNNFFFDKTMMKEYFSLKLLDEMGLPTPEYGLAKLYINDEYYGVYAMVEAYDKSILERYLGVDDDELSSYLVKPVGSNFMQSSIDENPDPLWESDEKTKAEVEDMLPTVYEWVEKLNALHKGKDFEGNKIDVNSQEYVDLLGQIYDLDEVVKYFAVHSWLCQMDNMFDSNQNFGLYIDRDGKAMLLPWDYDLSFGCFFPSTAETTANFNIDTMWRNGLWGPMVSAKSFYSGFPLFNVIYQNDSLMDKYHNYMLECSKIATLGGVVNGKSYEPGYFYSFIETLEEDLLAAASEKVADNVYYMNGITQPNGVKAGLPNLAKIIAMRSVGVYTQVKDIKTTVSGAGCNLETLGNAIQGDTVKRGTVTTVDAATGIFTTAKYANNNRQSPVLTIKPVAAEDTIFGNVLSSVNCRAEELTLYSIKNNAKPNGTYTITIPMSQEGIDIGKTYAVYICDTDGTVTQLETAIEGNLYTAEVEEFRYLAIVEGGNLLTDLMSEPGFDPSLVVLIGCSVLLAVVILVIFIMKKRKNN